MSIAELIMQGTEQNSKSTAWVSDSLQKIGQNVSAALKEREQQKQAQAMMPFLQQSMQESMELAGKGQSGDAYAKMIPLLTDPSTANNPYIMRVIPALQNGIEAAASDYQQNRRLDIAASRVSGSGGYRTQYEDEDDSIFQNNATQSQGTSPSKVSSPQVQSKQVPVKPAAVSTGVIQPSVSVSIPQDLSMAPTGLPATQQPGQVLASTPDTGQRGKVSVVSAEQPQQGQVTATMPMEEPDPETLKIFQKVYANYQNATPLVREGMRDKVVLEFDSIQEAKDNIAKLKTNQSYEPLDFGVVDPSIKGVAYSSTIPGAINAKGGQTRLPNTKGIDQRETWQNAANLVNGREDLAQFYKEAGGAKNVEVSSKTAKPAVKAEMREDDVPAQPETYFLKNRKTKAELQIPKDVYDKIAVLDMASMTSAATTNKMKLIKIRGNEAPITATPSATPKGKPQDFMAIMNAQFGQPKQTTQTPQQPTAQPSATPKSEFTNPENPFYQKVQQSQGRIEPKGGGRAGVTGEGRVKQIKDSISAIDTQIKNIAGRRGSPQDKYRAYQALKKQRDQLESDLSKLSK